MNCPYCGCELELALVQPVRDRDDVESEERRAAWRDAETAALLAEADNGQ